MPDFVLLALIRLAIPEVEDDIQQWKTDLKVLIDREADNTYLVMVNGTRLLLHIEYQNYLDDTMPLRMFHYSVALKLHYHQQYQEDIPVLPLVIWAKRGQTPMPLYQRGLSDDTSIVSRYREIHLNELDWQSVDPILLVLAPFLRGVTRQNAKEVAIQMYEAAPPQYRNLLLGALFNLMGRAFRNIDDIEQEILQQVRVTLDEIFEAVAEGPMGIRLIERGKAEGESKALAITWKVRFGEIPAEVSAALAEANATQLDALLDAFAAGAPEADLRAILGA